MQSTLLSLLATCSFQIIQSLLGPEVQIDDSLSTPINPNAEVPSSASVFENDNIDDSDHHVESGTKVFMCMEAWLQICHNLKMRCCQNLGTVIYTIPPKFTN